MFINNVSIDGAKSRFYTVFLFFRRRLSLFSQRRNFTDADEFLPLPNTPESKYLTVITTSQLLKIRKLSHYAPSVNNLRGFVFKENWKKINWKEIGRRRVGSRNYCSPKGLIKCNRLWVRNKTGLYYAVRVVKYHNEHVRM